MHAHLCTACHADAIATLVIAALLAAMILGLWLLP